MTVLRLEADWYIIWRIIKCVCTYWFVYYCILLYYTSPNTLLHDANVCDQTKYYKFYSNLTYFLKSINFIRGIQQKQRKGQKYVSKYTFSYIGYMLLTFLRVTYIVSCDKLYIYACLIFSYSALSRRESFFIAFVWLNQTKVFRKGFNVTWKRSVPSNGLNSQGRQKDRNSQSANTSLV